MATTGRREGERTRAWADAETLLTRLARLADAGSAEIVGHQGLVPSSLCRLAWVPPPGGGCPLTGAR